MGRGLRRFSILILEDEEESTSEPASSEEVEDDQCLSTMSSSTETGYEIRPCKSSIPVEGITGTFFLNFLRLMNKWLR